MMKLYQTIKPEPLKAQYQAFQATKPKMKGEILTFLGVDDMDVYNPSIPFTMDGMTVMACRVEARDSEHSKTMFFKKVDESTYAIMEEAPTFDLQDPFITFVGDELILGGVYVIWEGERITSWRTDFYRGTSLHDLKYFASGPSHMKDVRLLELRDGRIAIFSRPQGQCMLDQYGCIAKVGFTTVDTLDDVTPEAIDNATLLHDHFLPDEWGGCNQLFELDNGLIGVIGHKSWGEGTGENQRLHYYSIAFALDPDTLKMTPTKVIACRECFPKGQCKWLKVQDVTFTSGLIRNGNGTATLYTGLNDCQVGRLLMDDPLSEYETR